MNSGLALAPLLQAATTGGLNSFAPLAFQIVAIIAIFYFIMVRPQQRQRKQRDAMLAALKRGDEVVTLGGLVGEVIHIKEGNRDAANRSDDRVTIKSGESRLIVERGRIDRVITGSATPTDGAKA